MITVLEQVTYLPEKGSTVNQAINQKARYLYARMAAALEVSEQDGDEAVIAILGDLNTGTQLRVEVVQCDDPSLAERLRKVAEGVRL